MFFEITTIGSKTEYELNPMKNLYQIRKHVRAPLYLGQMLHKWG